jgi:hypothetical protein
MVSNDAASLTNITTGARFAPVDDQPTEFRK